MDEITDQEITDAVKEANAKALEIAKSDAAIEDFVKMLSDTIDNLHTITAMCVAIDGPRDPNLMATTMQKALNTTEDMESLEQMIVIFAQVLVQNLNFMRNEYIKRQLDKI